MQVHLADDLEGGDPGKGDTVVLKAELIGLAPRLLAPPRIPPPAHLDGKYVEPGVPCSMTVETPLYSSLSWWSDTR